MVGLKRRIGAGTWPAKVIFITGTDTGVGKTLLTALLLSHLRSQGRHALAMKPFCSGGRGDVRLLQSLQMGDLTDAEMNPFYFERPLAPLVAATGRRKCVSLHDVFGSVRDVATKCEVLLVEGSGGLLVPLGKGYTVADLIRRLRCRVIVVARNRLGTINHTWLTVRTLRSLGIRKADIQVILMSPARGDLSSRTNHGVLASLLRPIPVEQMPFLGRDISRSKRISAVAERQKTILNRLID